MLVLTNYGRDTNHAWNLSFGENRRRKFGRERERESVGVERDVLSWRIDECNFYFLVSICV